MRIILGLLALLFPSLLHAQESVGFPSLDADLTDGKPTALTALLYRPPGSGPFPAIVMLHGCGGLANARGIPFARHRDWADRMQALGYVVLLVDSFTPRGQREVCTQAQAPVRPGRERQRDAYAALRYLQSLAMIRPDRIGLLGWSNGGSTTLNTVAMQSAARRLASPPHDFAAAVAFYPGCASYPERWTTRIPLLMLIGEADDWTAPGPCKALQRRAAAAGAPVELVAYPDAHHGFDGPDEPIRVRKGVARSANGTTATTGTNPAARADVLQRVPAFFAARLMP